MLALAPCAALALLVVLATGVWGGGGFAWDRTVSDFIDDIAPVSSSDVHIDPWVDAATYVVGGVTLAFLALQVVAHRLRVALFAVVALAGTVGLSSLAKVIVQRPAIEGEGGYSFPSGSSSWAMATVTVAVLVASRTRLRVVVAILGVVFLAFYCGVLTFEDWHYPSDVLAGWLLAFAFTCAVWLASGRPRAGWMPVPRPSASAGRDEG